MKRSFNEVETMLRKAVIGAGLPVGLAEDIGRAGAWLAAHGYDGIGAVMSAVRDGMSRSVMPAKDGRALVFADARIAVCGPSAIDFVAVADAADEVRLLNADSPLLLIGFAGIAAASYGLDISLVFSNGGTASVSAGILALNGPVPIAGTDVVITCQDTGQTAQSGKPPASGVVVGEEIWREAEALAVRTYVPSSAASRAKGAGAGLTDND